MLTQLWRSADVCGFYSPASNLIGSLPAMKDSPSKRIAESSSYPDCVRYHPENNSTIFAVTNDDGDVVAVHEVFLSSDAREIGRRTTGLPEEGFVRFRGVGPATIVKDEPEEGMRLWSDTGGEVWVDVTGIPDSPSAAN